MNGTGEAGRENLLCQAKESNFILLRIRAIEDYLAREGHSQIGVLDGRCGR
jgi:hypothetical protein